MRILARRFEDFDLRFEIHSLYTYFISKKSLERIFVCARDLEPHF